MHSDKQTRIILRIATNDYVVLTLKDIFLRLRHKSVHLSVNVHSAFDARFFFLSVGTL